MATRGRKESARCPCFEDHEEFQKVVDLKEAGLVVYRLASRSQHKSKKNVSQQSTANNAADTFVLHNTKADEICSADIMTAFEKYGISCPRCIHIMENTKQLLKTVSKINKNDIRGICDHCRRKLTLASCTEFDRVVKKIVTARIEEKDGAHHVKMWLSKMHRLLKDVVFDRRRNFANRSYSDINIASIHRNSPTSTGGPKIRDVFYSETARTDSTGTRSLSERSYHSNPDFSKAKRVVAFIDPTESYRNANKLFYSQSEKDLTNELDDDWLGIHAKSIRGEIQAKRIRTSIEYESRTLLAYDNTYKKINTGLDFQSKKPIIGNGKSIKASYKTDQLGKSMTDFRDLTHVPPSRKYNSEEGLISAISDFVDDDDASKKDFRYYFPKEANRKFKKTLNVLSSSTLIKDTHEKLHVKAEQERKKRKEDRLKKEEEKELKKRARVEKKEQLERERLQAEEEAKIFNDKAIELEKQERKNAEETTKLQKTLPTEVKSQEKLTTEKENVPKKSKVKETLKESQEEKYALSEKTEPLKKSKKQGLKDVYEHMTKESRPGKNKDYVKKQTGQEIKDTSSQDKNKLTEKETVPKGSKLKENLEESQENLALADKTQSQKKSKVQGLKDEYEHMTKESRPGKNKDYVKEKTGQEIKDTSSQAKNKLSTKLSDAKKYNEVKTKEQKIKERDLKESKEQKDAFSQSKSKEYLKDNTDKAKSKLEKQEANLTKAKEQISKPERGTIKEQKEATKEDKGAKVTDEKEKDDQRIAEKQDKKDDLKYPEKGKELGNLDNKKTTKEGAKKQSVSKDDKKVEETFKKLLAEQARQKPEDQKQQMIKEKEKREAAEKKITDGPQAKSTNSAQSKKQKSASPSPLAQSKPEKKQEKPTTKELNIRQIKVRNTSTDDLLLQLVKMQQDGHRKDSAKNFDEVKVQGLLVNHKQHKNVKQTDCLVCDHSDLELELENFVYKKQISDELANIIIGEKIYKYKVPLMKKHKKEEMSPIIFKSTYDEENIVENKKVIHAHPEELDQKPPLSVPKTTKGTKIVEQDAPRGVIRYALSDRTFIDKGWTLLPTEKVVRKMNVYRMRPAHPEFDWFEHNKSKQLMQYDSGEKLAEFDENGRGRWFYKNGRVALDYYDAEETNAQQRIVVYSSGEPDERGRSRPFTILATFDYLGNGIVFDHSGKIRLKYNQTEGVVLDRAIGPVSHWKWHTLNDPPVLQQVMIDTQMPHKDPDILKLGGPGDTKTRPDNEEMLAIEFDNFIKEKSKKLSQTFKPFQIKMKALKINEQFSLKVLDQATVYLIFRDGAANLKLNLGMILDHKEIVDTDTAEVGEVSNSLERLPARTDSLAGLQKGVAHAQYVERQRVDRERRLRPTVPTASVDRLNAVATRPLRTPFRTCTSDASASTVHACKCRKPSSNNLYYDTRLI